MRDDEIRALGVAAAVLGWGVVVAPRLSARRRVPVQAVLGAGLVAWTRAPLGLRPPEVRRGLRAGLASAGTVSAVIAASAGLRPVRASMAEREIPDAPTVWLLWRIPVGTVWSEEAAYRAALGTVAAQAFGPRRGRLLQAVVFGLSHVPDARAAGDSVPGTVLVTGVAGWLFAWFYERTGSLVAPMLAHVATNEAGAVAALLATGRA